MCAVAVGEAPFWSQPQNSGDDVLISEFSGPRDEVGLEGIEMEMTTDEEVTPEARPASSDVGRGVRRRTLSQGQILAMADSGPKRGPPWRPARGIIRERGERERSHRLYEGARGARITPRKDDDYRVSD